MSLMTELERGRGQSSQWLRPRVTSQGAIRYLQTVRERWWLVVLAVVVAVAVAGLYVTTASKVYEAEADLLITPASNSDQTLTGLGLITESADPTQNISTAARLARTLAVAQATRDRLPEGGSAESILENIEVEPIAQSNLVAVRSKAGTAQGAAALANGFAEAVVQVRTTQLHREIATTLPRLQQQLEGVSADGRTTAEEVLADRVAALQALSAADDPTIRVASPATAPGSPASPKPKLAVAAAIIAGLIIGIGAAIALQALDPRLRREEQLRELFRLPVLARIPDLHVNRRLGPLAPDRLTPAAAEAYRTLRATLLATHTGQRRSFLVTSSSPGETKTTSAMNLAYALAHSGAQVILIEGDMRRPTLSTTLGMRPTAGVGSVLMNRVDLEDALVNVPGYPENLRFLLAEPSAAALADRLSLPSAAELVSDAEVLADWVVVDSPPLTEVIDALPLAQQVGGVVILAQLRRSRLNRLADLGEVLAQGGVEPAGLVVVGDDRASDESPYVTAGIAPAR